MCDLPNRWRLAEVSIGIPLETPKLVLLRQVEEGHVVKGACRMRKAQWLPGCHRNRRRA